MFGAASSLPLVRIFGIRIGVNLSWFVVLFLFIFLLQDSFTDILGDQTTGYLTAVLSVLLFFVSIVLHELGHALAARREGIGVSGIDLFFFGGVMKMSRDTDSPGAEFRVAVAGPLVTLLLVFFFGAVSIALAGGWNGFYDSAVLDGSAASDVAGLTLGFLTTMNIVLLVFNLIPAFPLDGGRIARAIAWKISGDRGKATRLSARIGQGFAILLIGLGIYWIVVGDLTQGLWMAVLGWLLGSAARTAVVQSAVTDRIEGITVADIMDSEPVTIPARRQRQAGLRGLLPALLRLGLVRGRRRERPLRRSRPPRRGRARGLRGGRRGTGGRGHRPLGPRGRGARRHPARGPARLRAAAPAGRADGGRRRRAAARRGDHGAGLARVADPARPLQLTSRCPARCRRPS